MLTDANFTVQIGRLTRDAELKQLKDCTLCVFVIAVNKKKKHGEAEPTNEVYFFDVNIYGKYAEIMHEDLKKSTQVCIIGELKQERWNDTAGNKKSRVVIIANKVQILGGKNGKDFNIDSTDYH